MTVYYKWLLPNYRTAVQEKTWPVDVGVWTAKETPRLCKSGWHGMEEKHVLTHLPSVIGAELWEVEVRGEIIHGDDKFAAEQMKLLRRVGTTTEANLRLFAADCAEDVLGLFLAVLPNDDRPAKAIEAAREYARGEITAAAGDAARAAARAAAWAAAGDAAGDAAGAAARDAARAAARAAAWAAAGDAAWDAAGAAAWAAAGDAAGDAAGAAAGDAAGDAARDAARAAARAAAWAKYSNWLVVRLESGF